MNAGDSFFALKNFAKGKINKYELMDADPLIYDVRVNSNNPAQSIVELRFQREEDFLKLLGLNDDDVWNVIAVNSSYQNYTEWEDRSGIREQFLEGYGVWNVLNDTNIDLMSKIAPYLGVGFKFEKNEGISDLAEKLAHLYKKEVDEICDDYAYEKNSEINITARESINSEIEKHIKDYGFTPVYNDGVKATVADFLSLYIQHNVPHESLKKLLKTVFSDDQDWGGWYENMWEYQNDENFDTDGFNRNVERVLEKILENLEEEEGIEPFVKMVNRITNKFKVRKWYKLPKDSRYEILIHDFDRDSRKIEVWLHGPENYSRHFKISEDGFYKLLYNLELFDLVDK